MKHRFMLFLPNHQLIGAIRSVYDRLGCEVTLRRYVGEHEDRRAVWRRLRPNEDWVRVFEAETFREIHITKSVYPKSGRDSTFQDRAADQSIVLTGGGQSEEVLARWIVLMPMPRGKARTMFGDLREELQSLTHVGMTAGRHTYQDAWYARGGGWSFVAGLYEGAVQYTPVE